MSSLWFRVAVVSGTAAAVGAVVVPVLAMGSSTLGAEAYSHVTRSSALMAYMLLWVTMLAGLSVTGKVGRKWPGMASSFGVHRYTSLLGLGFAVVHALALLGDPYMGYTPVGLLVPFMAGGYQPHWLGLGQVAIYLLAAVSLSFYVRDRLGVRAWRLVHSLSFALFLMALMHGLHSGSDSGTWWASGLYWMSGASVLLGSAYRMLSVRTGRRKALVAPTGLVVAGGRSQARPASRTLQTGS